MKEQVTVYGANWSPKTDKTQKLLSSLEVGYLYVNVDLNPMGKEEVEELNSGDLRLPTVVIEGHGTRILAEPDEVQLKLALAETKVVPWLML